MAEEKAVAVIDKKSVSFLPKNLDEAMALARVMAASTLIPREFQGQASNTLIAILHGAELGMSASQALSSIYVVNGKPSVYGDFAMGRVQASGLCEDWSDGWDPEKQEAWFEAKRKGQKAKRRSFSMADAKAAELTGRDTWRKYPKRMCFNRARAFCLRDVFPDVLRNVAIKEEMDDVIETTAVESAPQADNRLPENTNQVQESSVNQPGPAAEARAALNPKNPAPQMRVPGVPEPGTMDRNKAVRGEHEERANGHEPVRESERSQAVPPAAAPKAKRKPF